MLLNDTGINVACPPESSVSRAVRSYKPEQSPNGENNQVLDNYDRHQRDVTGSLNRALAIFRVIYPELDRRIHVLHIQQTRAKPRRGDAPNL